ncbi:PEP-CTERM sorting domain-containing protein [Mucisphaera calidilacus]|uniref:PEP-CTERM motif protein n=1 Tax=Mucisphaera calidilacus TaxID=2527982 RepID=A0A518BU18_9BACT|nr:PEP-CTERM sorting domain-containing protein [Mucisphaera calidilacus]QDU70468.1 PEP-CTERM motif protein [Mucisphaera calidilacus]
MNADTSKRILGYTTAATVGAFGAGQTATAAVIYTDLVPDITVGAVPGTDETFAIDFNGDGVDDALALRVIINSFSNNVQFRAFGYDRIDDPDAPDILPSDIPGEWVEQNWVFSNGPADKGPNVTYYARSFPAGTTIDDTLNRTGFKDPKPPTGGYGIAARALFGNPYNFINTGGFLGFQFEIPDDPIAALDEDGIGQDLAVGGSTTHFAWLEVDIVFDENTEPQIILKSWAYESTPDTALVAGEIPVGVPGDFNGDSVVDAADIDILLTDLGDPALDLDGDSDSDQDDVAFLLGDILGTAAGDANLDQAVDLLDLSALAANFNVSGVGWASGNFNGDAIVNLLDLSTLADNFGFSAPAIPEPTSLALLAAGAGALGTRRRR